MRESSVRCLGPHGFHRMRWTEWGDAANPRVLACVHGLTRCGRDFDFLASRLSDTYRVVCPDVAGRGKSDWLAVKADYTYATYLADMNTMLAAIGAEQVDWVGTSMGGLIGLGFASLPGSPVRKLILNEIGPTLDPAGIARIAGYVGQPAVWQTIEEAAAALWSVSQSFGPHSPEMWLELTRPQLVPAPGGGWMSHYDPAIAVPLRALTPELMKAGEALTWQGYDRIRCPTLLLRGAESDVLSPATAKAMTERGPKAQLVEFAGVGHAPTLVAADQRAAARAFLLGA
jgi:pimeloyl-ACP methyl ester carboxylesterase